MPEPAAQHMHSHPCNPPGGTYPDPGPCACGQTWEQSQAEIAEPARIMAGDPVTLALADAIAVLELASATLEARQGGPGSEAWGRAFQAVHGPHSAASGSAGEVERLRLRLAEAARLIRDMPEYDIQREFRRQILAILDVTPVTAREEFCEAPEAPEVTR